MPGSTVVLDRACNELVPCGLSNCAGPTPGARDLRGRLVNYATLCIAAISMGVNGRWGGERWGGVGLGQGAGGVGMRRRRRWGPMGLLLCMHSVKRQCRRTAQVFHSTTQSTRRGLPAKHIYTTAALLLPTSTSGRTRCSRAPRTTARSRARRPTSSSRARSAPTSPADPCGARTCSRVSARGCWEGVSTMPLMLELFMHTGLLPVPG